MHCKHEPCRSCPVRRAASPRSTGYLVDMTVIIVLDSPAGEHHSGVRLRAQRHRIRAHIDALEEDSSGFILDDVLVGLVSRLTLDQHHVRMLIVDFVDRISVGAVPSEGEH